MVIRSKRAASTACLRTTTGLLVLLLAALSTRKSTALSLFRDESNRRPNFAEPHDTHGAVVVARRQVVSSILATAAFTTTGIEVFASSPSFAIANAADAAAATSGNQPPLSDSFNVDQYLKTGMVQNPMGVSGQAGEYTLWIDRLYLVKCFRFCVTLQESFQLTFFRFESSQLCCDEYLILDIMTGKSKPETGV